MGIMEAALTSLEQGRKKCFKTIPFSPLPVCSPGLLFIPFLGAASAPLSPTHKTPFLNIPHFSWLAIFSGPFWILILIRHLLELLLRAALHLSRIN